LIGDRLIVTPHAAWSSPESVHDARRLSVETAMLYLREGKLRNLVNRPSSQELRGAASRPAPGRP
jgi:D-3-phosphoglycerate dehydrogenase / 2-oxoglutarate reductase